MEPSRRHYIIPIVIAVLLSIIFFAALGYFITRGASFPSRASAYSPLRSHDV